MKKITFLFSCFTVTINAQNFPSPYCEIADPDDVTVEEITVVNVNNEVITNTNITDVHVDYTTTAIPISPDMPHVLRVYGNTYGDFDTDVVAFIDWNNNNILDDSGEIYPVGTLSNSDGNDGVFVETQISVPSGAVGGMTRVRITKTYTDPGSVAIIDACGITFDPFGFGPFPGFGQALDFTLNVNNLSTGKFDDKSLSIYPVPAKNTLTIAYKSEIGNIQVYSQLGQEIFRQSGLGSELNLDVSNYAVGVYIIKIFNEQESKTFKIVKN